MDIDMYGVGRFPDFEAQTHVAQRETFEEWQWDVQVVSLLFAIPLPPTPTINELFIVISMGLYWLSLLLDPLLSITSRVSRSSIVQVRI